MTLTTGQRLTMTTFLSETESMTEPTSKKAIDTFDRVGLGPGLNYIAGLLDGHGQEKHGDDDWKRLWASELQIKTLVHLTDAIRGRTKDNDSGAHPMAHVAVRAVMFCVKWVER